MEESDQREEPDYMVVLDRIYQKDSTVAYPELTHSLIETHQQIAKQGEEEMYRRMEILNEIPSNKSLLPIQSMDDHEIYQSLRFLKNIDLIEEPDEVHGMPLSSVGLDSVRYVGLTEKGFEVAHDRAIRQRQQEILESQNESSHLLAVVTVLLGATALVQALAAVFDLSWPLNLLLGLVYCGVLVLVLLWWNYYA